MGRWKCSEDDAGKPGKGSKSVHLHHHRLIVVFLFFSHLPPHQSFIPRISSKTRLPLVPFSRRVTKASALRGGKTPQDQNSICAVAATRSVRLLRAAAVAAAAWPPLINFCRRALPFFLQRRIALSCERIQRYKTQEEKEYKVRKQALAATTFLALPTQLFPTSPLCNSGERKLTSSNSVSRSSPSSAER